VAEHITEEEQIEAFKRWWNENGTSLFIGVLLAVGGYFGLQFWQTQQQQAREQASVLYNDMIEVGIAQPGEPLTDQDINKVQSLADELMADHKNTLYASNAAMLLAKIAVEKNDLAGAETQLRWVLDNGPSDSVTALASVRLAMVLFSADKFDEALALVSEAPSEGFASRYAETRGDILMAQGKLTDAMTAYQLALDTLLQNQSSRRDMIQMKITDIESTLTPADAAAPSSAATVNDLSGEAAETDAAASEPQ